MQSLCETKKKNENPNHLIKRQHIGAKPGALPFVALNGRGYVGNDNPTRKNDVPRLIVVNRGQPFALASGESYIFAQIVTHPNNRDGFLRRRVGV